MRDAWLVIETSGRGGRVGLALDGGTVREVALDAARRHNRDLAPAVAEVLRAEGLSPKHLNGVMVSHGPGSYTGLRVGVMSAKALAYATGCRLVAVPTFHAIAELAPAEAEAVEVIGDALQGMVYAQQFRRIGDNEWEPAGELAIVSAKEWAARLTPGVWVSGPGVALHDALIPATVPRVAEADRVPSVSAVFRVGRRLAPLTPAEVMRLEPLYLRGSSAEEKAKW